LIAASILDAMRQAANDEISVALSRASSGISNLPRTEPGLVAAVHQYAIGPVGHAWSGLLSPLGLRLKISGVFCHQSPIVTFHDASNFRRRCELADLMVVVDTKAGRLNTRKAVLIQAKMASCAGTVSLGAISSLNQLKLYQTWPLLDFDQPAYGLSSVDVKLGSGSSCSGSFGVIDRHLRSASPRWTQHPVSPTPSKTVGLPELGDFLARMTAGLPNYGRDADLGARTPWSNMIDVLLQSTRNRVFHLGTGSYHRAVTAMALLQDPSMAFQTLGGEGAPPEGEIIEMEVGQPLGISTIHIELF